MMLISLIRKNLKKHGKEFYTRNFIDMHDFLRLLTNEFASNLQRPTPSQSSEAIYSTFAVLVLT